MGYTFNCDCIECFCTIYSNISQNNTEEINEGENVTTAKEMYPETEGDEGVKINNETEKNGKTNEQQSNCYWYVFQLDVGLVGYVIIIFLVEKSAI